ncbi:MAG: sorbosone dehydrogenase family protein, partial [Oxalobacteraceae bacterium]
MTMKRLRTASSLIVVAMLAGCNDKGGDPSKQYGSNPDIPESHQYVIPPMSVPQAVGWKEGETPTVPGGLRIQAMANGLMHPRVVYPLSNGDILVVESNGPGTKPFRPKDYISGLIKARGGSADKGGNRITLLRDADGDGVPESKTVLVDHLHSPYGVAVVADTLYVANTDAIIAYPFKPGQTEIKEPGTKLTDLPAGPINHHWTKS